VFLDLAAKVKANEAGCLVYQLTKSRTEPGVYKVLELYADSDALKAHGQTEYFKASGAKMGPTMAGAPVVEYLDAVE
jgi:quinol monooxygenase YgiN